MEFITKRVKKPTPFRELMRSEGFTIGYDLATDGFCREAREDRDYADRFMIPGWHKDPIWRHVPKKQKLNYLCGTFTP